MDKEIRKKYDNFLPPFDDKVLSCVSKDDDNIPLTTLRKLTNSIINFLMENNLIDKVYKCYDWQEHDGFLTVKELVSDNFLKSLVMDNDAFYSERSGDTWVNIGLFDNQSRWYFRIYIIDENDLDEGEEICGQLDISITKGYVDLLQDKLANLFDVKMKLTHPKEFFQNIFI